MPADVFKTPFRWYATGLAFECTQCEGCCHAHGSHAWVFIDAEELKVLANGLGVLEPDFVGTYCTTKPEGWALKFVDGVCPFLEHGRCRVYPQRPAQCRTWPFWPENVYSVSAWERVAKFCPGIGRGMLHGAEEIEMQVRRTRRKRR